MEATHTAHRCGAVECVFERSKQASKEEDEEEEEEEEDTYENLVPVYICVYIYIYIYIRRGRWTVEIQDVREGEREREREYGRYGHRGDSSGR